MTRTNGTILLPGYQVPVVKLDVLEFSQVDYPQSSATVQIRLALWGLMLGRLPAAMKAYLMFWTFVLKRQGPSSE